MLALATKPHHMIFHLLLLIVSTAHAALTCDNVKTSYKGNECCGLQQGVTKEYTQEQLYALIQTMYNGDMRTKPCTPETGDILQAFPFQVKDANSIGYNAVDLSLNMAYANSIPGIENVTLTDQGLESPLGDTGYMWTWVRKENMVSDMYVNGGIVDYPDVLNYDFDATGALVTNILPTVSGFRPFLNIYFHTSAMDCWARYEGTGPFIDATFQGGQAVGTVVGKMSTDSTCPTSIRDLLHEKHYALKYDFATHGAAGVATAELRPWTNPEACLPLRMGLTGWMMT